MKALRSINCANLHLVTIGKQKRYLLLRYPGADITLSERTSDERTGEEAADRERNSCYWYYSDSCGRNTDWCNYFPVSEAEHQARGKKRGVGH